MRCFRPEQLHGLGTCGKDDDVHGASSPAVARELGRASALRCPPKDADFPWCPLLFAPGITATSEPRSWGHPGAQAHKSALEAILWGDLWYKGVQRGVGVHPSHCCPMPSPTPG